jgi:hypothetical protein
MSQEDKEEHEPEKGAERRIIEKDERKKKRD